MMTLYVKAGDVIFEQGDTQRTMFCIEEGKVSIVIDYGKDSEKQLTELKAGQFFGEMSLLEAEPRSATAIALTDGALEVIDEESFNEYIESNPSFAMMLMKYFSARLRAVTADYQEACRTIAQVYDVEGVKEAIQKADEETSEETEVVVVEETTVKKGFLARSMEKFKEIYNSGGNSEMKYYNF